MGRQRASPEPAQEPGDDSILLGLRHFVQARPRHAPLEVHGVLAIVRVNETRHGGTFPEAQAGELKGAFQVRHSQLEDGRRPVRKRHRRHPRAAAFMVLEGNSQRERPSAPQLANDFGQPLEPCRALGCPAARRGKPLRNDQGHSGVPKTRGGSQLDTDSAPSRPASRFSHSAPPRPRAAVARVFPP